VCILFELSQAEIAIEANPNSTAPPATGLTSWFNFDNDQAGSTVANDLMSNGIQLAFTGGASVGSICPATAGCVFFISLISWCLPPLVSLGFICHTLPIIMHLFMYSDFSALPAPLQVWLAQKGLLAFLLSFSFAR
jgi:hypothetical protein